MSGLVTKPYVLAGGSTAVIQAESIDLSLLCWILHQGTSALFPRVRNRQVHSFLPRVQNTRATLFYIESRNKRRTSVQHFIAKYLLYLTC